MRSDRGDAHTHTLTRMATVLPPKWTDRVQALEINFLRNAINALDKRRIVLRIEPSSLRFF